MTTDARERNAPTHDELEDLLGMLVAANDGGQVVGLAFMLKNGDQAAIDYRGSHEMVELMTRTVRERIRDEIQHTHPRIAAQLTAELDVQVH